MLDYDALFKWAVANNFGNIEKFEGLDGLYGYGRLVFGHSTYGRVNLLIYVVDGSEQDMIEDFKDVTLLVYSGQGFVQNGGWNQYIENYFQTIQNKVDEEALKKEQVKKEEKEKAEISYQERLDRFELLFNDSTKPVITILGDNPLDLNVGDEYVEVGATALDEVDGDLTEEILMTGEVDVSVESQYIITYSVEDRSGNKTAKERVVNVIAVEEELEEEE